MIEFRAFGQVEVGAATGLVDVGQPRQRLVLAALLVDAGRLVTVDTLVDRVWGESPPTAARRALHSHIARVRKALLAAADREATPVPLVHRSGGYLLDVDREQVDLHRFGRLVRRAGDRNRTADERVGLLREALGLWRGEPLAGLPGPWAAQVRQVYWQQYLDATVAWAAAEIQVGNPGAVVVRLTDLVADHPLVESLVAALMCGLHATGRTAEALARYAATRQLIREDLGTEPGAELRQLHQAILRGDPQPATASPGRDQPAPDRSASRASAPLAPAQLPLDVYGFVGRVEALARLDAILAGAQDQPTAVVITAVSGTAGVGKSALALHWAHRNRDRFPDGQLYVNLRGYAPTGAPMSAAEALRRFLDGLGVPPQRIPADVDAQGNLYRSLLADKRVLVVLDNAHDAGHIRPLLPGGAATVVVVTSRNQMTSLIAMAGAHPIDLDLLTADEAREMLARRVGRRRVIAEPAATDEIVWRCARLPLALAIASARAATHPDFPLAAIARELSDAHRHLDAFATADPASNVRSVFSWSLRAVGVPAARLFRLLGVHPGPDISVPAAASLAGIPPPQVRPLLAELDHAHLVTEPVPGRYTFHDLLRAYAAELAHLHPAAERTAATRRMLLHYLHSARTAALQLNPYRDPITLATPEPGVHAENLDDYAGALEWFNAEHPVLLAIIDQVRHAGLDEPICQLASTISTFLDRRAHWPDLVRTQHAALAAARRLADRNAEAGAHRALGHAYTMTGRNHDAETHYQQALARYREMEDHIGQAHTHLNLSVVWGQQRRADHALSEAEQALALFRTAGHRAGQADALNNMGWYHAELGDTARAVDCCERALALQQNLDDRSGQAHTWDSLGHAYEGTGEYGRAIACYRRSLDLWRELAAPAEEAVELSRLGDAYLAAGNQDGARRAWQQAVSVLDELDPSHADRVRARLRDLDRTTAGSPGRDVDVPG